MSAREQVGQTIKAMRLGHSMTQKDLASSIGQSESSIAMYERGKREPDFETMEAIARVFNVPMSSLVGEINYCEEQPTNKEVRTLMKGMNKLPHAQQEQLLNVARAMFAEYADYFKTE